MKYILAIVIFSIIILFHEFGHFLLAKKSGIVVLEFSLGMGPKLLSKEYKGTRYCLKLLPLGGSCMMLGEDEENSGPGTFNNATISQRMAVIAAGPVFNFILAFVFSVIIIACVGYVPAEVTAVEENSAVAGAGLQEGDVITEFNGYRIDIGNDLYTYEALNGISKDSITLTYKRNDEKQTITYQPEVEERYLMGFQYVQGDSAAVTYVQPDSPFYGAGIQVDDVITAINDTAIADGTALANYFTEHPMNGDPIKVTFTREGLSYDKTVTPEKSELVSTGFNYNLASVKTTPLNVIKYSAIEVKYWVKTTVLSLQKLIGGKFGIKDLSGPVGVVTMIGDTYEESRPEGIGMVIVNMLYMAVLLSANLGVMNLLPIPALDGGRLVFLIVEAIRRKPNNRQIEGVVNFASLMLLLALMVVVMYNDVLKLF